MNPTPIALQLWSVKDEMRCDFAATVAQVAEIGYRGVELAGYGNLDVQGVDQTLRDAGLSVTGLHINFDKLSSNLNAVVSDALLLKTRYVTCSIWPKEQFVSVAACEGIGLRLAQIGEIFRSFGIRFGFHNHAPEVTQIGGRSGLDWLFDAAAPRDLVSQPDVYWLHSGGYAPAQFLRRYGARCPLIHIKDHGELGCGPVDFAELFSIIDDIGAAEWLIVVQEIFNYAPLEAARRNFAQLRAWGRC